MTMTLTPMPTDVVPRTVAVRPTLITRSLMFRLVSVVASSIGFYLPLSVVPLYAASTGSAGGAGLATVALLLTTVVCELLTPRIVARVGYRWALALGLILLGAPTLVLTVSSTPAVIIAVSMVRGAGFAITIVAGGAVTATLIPKERRGEGLALVGLVGGVPSLLALPAGVWASVRWGFDPVFVVTAAAPLLALVTVPALPRRGAAPAEQHGVLAGLRNSALTRPALVFTASASAAGVLVTFLPLATSGQASWVPAAALLAQPAASTASRWVAGRIGDRHGQRCLLVPGLTASAVGMVALAATGTPVAVIAGSATFGIGFGILQNATLALMYSCAPAGGESAVSAIWNASYDLGMAAGALAVGLLVTPVGYPVAFVLTAAMMLPALLPALRDARFTGRTA
jgi:MFS family permease